MKLSKDTEVEIRQIYQAYWDAYLGGDFETFASFLDDDIVIYGTAVGEIFTTREDALKFYTATSEEMTGKAEFRNREISIVPVGDTVVIYELSQLYILIEDTWTFYGFARITGIFEKKGNEWKLVHQHGSFPDSRTEEGQQIASEKIKEENLQLREAVQRRTVELENKTRELEIESSLERVRTVAMGMRQPDDMLQVCRVISEQLQVLGIKDIRNVQTAIIDEQGKGTYMNYQYFTQYGEGSVEEVVIAKHPAVKDMIEHMQQSPDAFFNHSFMGVELEEWKQYRKDQNQFPDPILEDSSALHFYFYSIGEGGLGLSVYTSLTAEDLSVFHRLRNVFALAYQRFRDIEQAEVQTQEAQVELALERVRASSMAMQKSEELQEVIQVVYDQFKLLNIDIEHTGFIMDYRTRDDMHIWLADKYVSPFQITLPYFDSPHWNSFLEAKSSGDPFFANLLNFEEKNKFYEDLFKLIPGMPEESRQIIFSKPGLAISTVLLDNVGLYIENFSGTPYTDEENAMLLRFGKVFQQAYTRFLDLQKVEAQGQEVQIELSLERIRSQVTAMQESSDLLDIVVAMRSEFVNLGHEAHYFWHMRWLPESYAKAMTSGDGTKIGMVMTLPRHIHGDIEQVANWEKSDETIHVLAMDAETAVDYVHKMITLGDFERVDPQSPTLDDIRAIGGLTFVMARTTHGEIGYSLPGVVPDPSKDAVNTLVRFAGVFDLAYKRFEDLKARERQHREGQIELAIERVRARSLAMHSSGELADLSLELVKQVYALGIDTWFCAFNIYEDDPKGSVEWGSNGQGIFPQYRTPREGIFLRYYEAGQKGETLFVNEINEKECPAHYEYLCSLPGVGEQLLQMKDAGIPFPTSQIDHVAFFKYGYILFITFESVPEAHEIFKRFANVFEQTYTRFLDLQKAEAQAREAKIEAALEKVRSRSLAMHNSSELNEVVKVLFEKITELQVPSTAIGIQTFIEGSKDMQVFVCGDVGTGIVVNQYVLPYFDHPIVHDYLNAHKNKPEAFVGNYSKKVKDSFYDVILKLPELNDLAAEVKTMIHDSDFYEVTIVPAEKSMIAVNDFLGNPLAESQVNILKRFAKVFDQSYTRFLDLEKAEAQAREAQIEAALERVRSHSMGMQSSADFGLVTTEMFNQLRNFGAELYATGIVFCDKHEGHVEQWHSIPGGGMLSPFIVPVHLDYIHQYRYDQWKSGKELFSVEIPGDFIEQHFDAIFKLPSAQIALKDLASRNAPMPATPPWEIDYGASFKNGYILISSLTHFENTDILPRFAKVFEQTYTRFLDLQKAEAQTREAKIEAALEKVRSRTMGMQSSEELPEVANVLFLEVQSLGIPAWSCGYNILAEDKKTAICCMSSEGTLQTPFRLRLWGEASFDEMGDFLQSEKTMLVQELGDSALKEHYGHMKSFPDLKSTFDQIDSLGLSLPTYQINHLCKFTQGFLLFITYEKVPESHDLFNRFTKVFDQTYTRFLDLKKAENQAREAQIENALEKVRSRSLAMQTPDELIEVAQLLREEMGALGVEELETSSIYIHNEENGTTQCWFTIKNADDPVKAVTDQMTLDLQGTWVGRKMMEFYRSPAHHTSILMQGENRIEWIRYCEEKSALFSTNNFYGETIPDRTYHLYKFSNGFVGAASPGEISAESWDLLKRATNVFSFAYTRFHDLQVAEASASAALRQASLDRVRADIAAMRSTQDLQRITPLIWQELTNLRVSFIRCGVFIMDEDAQVVHTYLSTADGKNIAAIHLPYSGMSITENAVAHWRQQTVYIDHWDKSGFHQWTKQLVDQGHITSAESYQGGATPDHLHLHFVPFAQGMLYVGSVDPLPEESIDLIHTLASAFATAYARYEDFNKLELAKKSTDLALADLEAAKDQLVQQEKLASLGQLTAGIAHEIKNPLNFVTNFSEVSSELLDELLEELEQGNSESVKSISDVIKANLNKIHEHGSRADSIVKSMLMHSRGGSGQKEPTDLNTLIREYVNLTFHGMRAGKQPINVQIDLQLDEPTDPVPVIVEDISRVIINLCNNAYDAMRDKLSDPSRMNGYTPKLSIRTKANASQVTIEIADNGPGIPEEVKDKILQPFFTTKKGTQGTGLGLSITNDIVKAHGGELKVETTQGEGTVFKIQLPKT